MKFDHIRLLRLLISQTTHHIWSAEVPSPTTCFFVNLCSSQTSAFSVVEFFESLATSEVLKSIINVFISNFTTSSCWDSRPLTFRVPKYIGDLRLQICLVAAENRDLKLQLSSKNTHISWWLVITFPSHLGASNTNLIYLVSHFKNHQHLRSTCRNISVYI